MKKLREASGNGNRGPEKQQEHAQQAADRHEMIAIAAYFRAIQRGFQEGGELDDWLAAEAEVNVTTSS